MTTPDLAGLCERLRADADTWAETRDHEGPEIISERLEREAAAAIESLVAALEPFARVLKAVDDDSDVPDGATLTNSNVMASMLFYGDLRRARTALEGASDDR